MWERQKMDVNFQKIVENELAMLDYDADLHEQIVPVLWDGDLSATLRFCEAGLEQVLFPSSFGHVLSAAAAILKSKAPDEKQKAQITKLCCPGLSIAMDKCLNSNLVAAWSEDVHVCIFQALVGLRELGAAILSQLPNPNGPPLDTVCLLEIMKALAVFVDDENKYHEMYSERGAAAFKSWNVPCQTEEAALKKSFERIHMKLLKSMLLTPSFWHKGVDHFTKHLEQGAPAPAVRYGPIVPGSSDSPALQHLCK